MLVKKFTPLLLTVTFGLWAADFWQSKPYTEWNDKDVQRIETNSPWSKQVPISMGEGGGGGGTGKGSRKGGGGGGAATGGDDPVMGSGGNAGGSRVQEVGGAGGAGASSLTVTVSWRTALPLRQAAAKAKFGSEAATSPDAKKLTGDEQPYYGIVVTGLPARVVRSDNEKLKQALLENTSLIVKGKDPIHATDVQLGGNERNAVAFFMFPKTAPLSVDDKEVDFSSKLGPLTVKQKFHLKDMVFNGKLEL